MKIIVQHSRVQPLTWLRLEAETPLERETLLKMREECKEKGVRHVWGGAETGSEIRVDNISVVISP